MGMHQALLQEFAARKEQVLNLEMRLFLLILALEAFFALIYVLNLDRVRQGRDFALGATLVYFVLFLELVAINGKMGLVSMYLRQMEEYMASLGYVGAVWESKALDAIVFRPGNAFTLPAGLTILVLLVQTAFVVYLLSTHFSRSSGIRVLIAAAISVLLVSIVVKTITVDFYRRLPPLYPQTDIGNGATFGESSRTGDS